MNMADMMYGTASAGAAATVAVGGDLAEESNADYYGGMANNNNRLRFPGLYVGNLTWWTTDQDVINAINSVGVNDVQEVKFFENRNNGQSKGFCVVTFTSELSLPLVMEKLPKLELYGQNPVVTPFNRQNLNIFESQNKARPQLNSNNGPNSHAAGIMGISSISGVHAATQGMPYSAGMNASANYIPGAGNINAGGPRPPPFHGGGMRMQMRNPRPVMRGTLPNSMNNGPMIPGGHQMNRMRYGQPQPGGWNSSQGGGGGIGGGGYNTQSTRMPQINMDMSNRLGGMGVGKPNDIGVGQDMLSAQGSQSYYNPHHSNSQSDLYRSDHIRDHRDHLRDDRDLGRRFDDRSLRQDDRRDLRGHDDRSSRDDRSHKQDDKLSSSRRDERPSRREEERGSSRRDIEDRDRGSSRRGDERSSRREKDSSSSRREKSHRTDERMRSRSRDRSRERKRDRRERY